MFEFLREHRRKPTHASEGNSEAFLAKDRKSYQDRLKASKSVLTDSTEQVARLGYYVRVEGI